MAATFLLMVTGCGHSGVKGSDQRAIRAALAQWAAARTPAQACDVMSSGFRFFVGKDDYLACAANFVSALGPVAPESVTVESMREQAGQVEVRAVVSGARTRGSELEGAGQRIYWFVWQRGAWRLNSIGDEVGLGPPCRTYPGHPC